MMVASPPSAAAGPRNYEEWETRFLELYDYKEKYNTTDVPIASTYGECGRLGAWVVLQRQHYRQWKNGQPSLLSDERRMLLDAIGFIWDSKEKTWMEHYQDLCEYEEQHGHCHVSRTYDGNPTLGAWAYEQRKYYSILQKEENLESVSLFETMPTLATPLTSERIALLNQVGFVWNASDWMFRRKIDELHAYREQHRSVHGYELLELKATSGALGVWFVDKKRQYRNYLEGKPHPSLDAERIQLLEGAGLTKMIAYMNATYERTAVDWETRIAQIVSFKSVHGHCDVPQRSNDTTKLGTWVCNMRTRRKRGLLNKTQVRRLDKIGFVWDSVAFRWEERYKELVAYKKENGHTNVPANQPSKLGRWVSRQRTLYNAENDGLTRKQIKALDKIGFEWKHGRNIRKSQDLHFQKRVREYLRATKNEVAPGEMSESLKRWTQKQRHEYRKYAIGNHKNTLTNAPSRIVMLEESGLVDDIQESNGRRGDSRFQRFVKEYQQFYNGPAKNPAKKPPKALALWVANQRTAYRKLLRREQSELTKFVDRVAVLERIGAVDDIIANGIDGCKTHPDFQERVKEYERMYDGTTKKKEGAAPSKSLEYWVKNQRHSYRRWLRGEKSPLATFPERIGDLLRVGMVDDIREAHSALIDVVIEREHNRPEPQTN